MGNALKKESFGRGFGWGKDERKEGNDNMEKKFEEISNQIPTIIVNKDGIYLVEGNKVSLKRPSNYSSKYCAEFIPGTGVVQDGEEVYYLHNVSKTDFTPQYYLSKMNLITGTEEHICEMESVCLCGIRKNSLFYIETYDDEAGFLYIGEMNLDNLQKVSHKIEMKAQPLIGYMKYSGDDIGMQEKHDYPLIDKTGCHMYFRVQSDKNGNRAGIADVNLKRDDYTLAWELKNRSNYWYKKNWGIGDWMFFVRDFENSNDQTGSCWCYDLVDNEEKQLGKLKECMYSSVSQMLKGREIEHLCCGEGCIYWLVEEIDFAQVIGWTLMEYSITENVIEEKAHWKKGETGSFNLRIKEMYVNNQYIYLNSEDRYGFYSWRISMKNWKIEQLVEGKIEEWESYEKDMMQKNIHTNIDDLICAFGFQNEMNLFGRRKTDYFYVCIE